MKDDKRKIAIVIGLVVVVLGIGAWQFSSSLSQPNNKKQKEVAEKAPKDEQANSDVLVADLDMIGLTRRNPFQPSPLADMDPRPQENPPAQQNPSSTNSSSSGRRITSDINTTVPPWVFSGDPQWPAGGEASISESAPLRPSNEFAYTLIGVVDGPRPVAVFRGDDGGQRMVRVNESVGSNSKVVGIQNGQVKVQHNGKTITLSVGGN
ncbi:MAG: hypothetical protein KIT74_11840 [Fimbriimonadales bacterium]|nr:hypothetical protein [Fimbriimonadales bacterium]